MLTYNLKKQCGQNYCRYQIITKKRLNYEIYQFFILLKIQVVYYEGRLFLINYISVIDVVTVPKINLKKTNKKCLSLCNFNSNFKYKKGNIELKFMKF